MAYVWGNHNVSVPHRGDGTIYMYFHTQITSVYSCISFGIPTDIISCLKLLSVFFHGFQILIHAAILIILYIELLNNRKHNRIIDSQSLGVLYNDAALVS